MFDGDRRWQDIRASGGDTFEWPNDNYMKEPPFFLEVGPELPATEDIVGARPLVLLADSITTDHISPVGTITATSAAGQYLIDQGVPPRSEAHTSELQSLMRISYALFCLKTKNHTT